MAAAAAVADAPAAPPVLPYRVGHGFDLHRLAEGYKLIIGGVEIPHTKGCEAHSDGGRADLGPLWRGAPCGSGGRPPGPGAAAGKDSSAGRRPLKQTPAAAWNTPPQPTLRGQQL
jgi:hypothetical protein